MQYAPIALPPRKYDTSKWTRKRQNWDLYKLTYAPLDELRNTEFDPWSYDHENKCPVFTSNPTWEAAVKESERRLDLYERLVPVSKWGI
jgi:hypothetical protein